MVTVRKGRNNRVGRRRDSQGSREEEGGRGRDRSENTHVCVRACVRACMHACV